MGRARQAYAALGAVMDPELDEPITTLGFVRSLVVSPGRERQGAPAAADVVLLAELRLPDGVGCERRSAASWIGRATWSVELDDHHDSAIINAGLAADAGYRGTFGHEARGEPRRPAGDVSAEGPYGGDGAVPHGAATGRPATSRVVVGRGPSGRPARRRHHRGACCVAVAPSDCPRRQTTW